MSTGAPGRRPAACRAGYLRDRTARGLRCVRASRIIWQPGEAKMRAVYLAAVTLLVAAPLFAHGLSDDKRERPMLEKLLDRKDDP
jgi:hypothetical protein